MQLAFLEMCPVVYQQDDIVFLFHPFVSSQNAHTSVCIQVMCIVNVSEFVPYLALFISMCHPQEFFTSGPKWHLILICSRSDFVHHTLAATACRSEMDNTRDICISSNAKGFLKSLHWYTASFFPLAATSLLPHTLQHNSNPCL